MMQREGARGFTRPVEGPSFTFKDEAFSQDIMRNLARQRHQGLSTDFKVVVEGASIPAHRCILMASSAFFEDTLKPAKGQEEGRLELIGPKYGAMKLLIDFMYSGEVDINASNNLEVLMAANCVGMTKICSACDEFLLKRMGSSNCVDLLRRSTDEEKMKSAADFFARNFFQLNKSNGISTLDASLLSELLSRDDLMIFSEVAESDNFRWPTMENTEAILLETVLQCIRCHPREKSALLSDLLRAVRLPFLPKDKLQALLNEPAILGNAKLKEIVI
jgi:hypothetical protein